MSPAEWDLERLRWEEERGSLIQRIAEEQKTSRIAFSALAEADAKILELRTTLDRTRVMFGIENAFAGTYVGYTALVNSRVPAALDPAVVRRELARRWLAEARPRGFFAAVRWAFEVLRDVLRRQ